MVGAIVKAGLGQITEDKIRAMLEEEPKTTPFPPPHFLSPAHGLFLSKVFHSEIF